MADPIGFRSQLPELTLDQASILIVKSARTVRRLTKREVDPVPCKHLGQGRPLLFELEPLVRWCERERLRDLRVSGDETLDLQVERAMLARAQRELTQQTMAARAGDLIEVAVVQRDVGRMIGNARQRLLGVPSRLGAGFGPSVAGAAEALILEALEQLAATRH